MPRAVGLTYSQHFLSLIFVAGTPFTVLQGTCAFVYVRVWIQ